ncbi:MAG: hypothetical protein ACK4N5_11865 [Myxococcales bacterium]
MVTRWVRFILYSVFVGAALALNAGAIKLSLRLLTTDAYFAPDAPCIPCALGILAVGAAYAFWLAGATVIGWRMPLFSHLVPIGLVIGTMALGPLKASRADLDTPVGAAERAVGAMRALLAEAKRTGSLCNRPAEELERVLASTPGVLPPGYRSFGREVGYRIRTHTGYGDAVRHVDAKDRPGTLHLSCGSNGAFWLTGVVSDVLPVGHPSLVRDGVGRVVVMTSEVTQ